MKERFKLIVIVSVLIGVVAQIPTQLESGNYIRISEDGYEGPKDEYCENITFIYPEECSEEDDTLQGWPLTTVAQNDENGDDEDAFQLGILLINVVIISVSISLAAYTAMYVRPTNTKKS